jgi:hypothetical protein
MATVITVHGTFASGPESGEQWWQKGSQFESEMRRLVESEDGKLDFEPHIWDGLNSETSRRAAGKSLLGRLSSLEKEHQCYCLIGHSHGGSVILSSLQQSLRSRVDLSRLSRWITVGTPFIAFRPKTFLFSRLGLLGQTLYLSFATSVCLLFVTLWEEEIVEIVSGLVVLVTAFLFVHTLTSWIKDRSVAASGAILIEDLSLLRLFGRFLYIGALGFIALTVIEFVHLALGWHYDAYDTLFDFSLAGVAILLFYVIARIRYVPRGSQRWRKDLAAAFSRWLSLWFSLRHAQDEAIEGLRQLPRISFPIFGRNFAVVPLTFISLMVFPVLIVAILLMPHSLDWWSTLWNVHEPVKENFTDKMNALLSGPVDFGIHHLSLTVEQAVVPALLFTISIFLLVGVGYLITARSIAVIVSRFLSAVFDQVAWQQLRASAFGSNTFGEVSQSASEAPSFFNARPSLPTDLASEISKVADAAAAASLSKLRSSLNRFAFAEEKREHSDLVSQYLTWDELIHTSYFRVPLFNKLVAYAIAQSEGFRVTASFIADPDYSRVAAWYAELTSRRSALPQRVWM